uniref:Uncharacterized protein n=1 Tax=Rhizophora mucronata TaxID=61149 RepID=A0A2P2PWD7_RHIMU
MLLTCMFCGFFHLQVVNNKTLWICQEIKTYFTPHFF